eukprot:GFUD01025423.1.p1 GENE.GFUD01025423.1~~GFUD01025423.1.p1  ORF type:complete len:244 (+),score=82.71 GFUD01025423.1:334-1065(+)
MVGRLVSVLNLGTMKYQTALAVQNILVNRIQSSLSSGLAPSNTLVLVEHTPVYTTGMRSKEYSQEEEFRLKDLGADFVRTKRGGLITFHGPGQLVAYPVLNLRDFAPESSRRKALLGMKWYVWTLEQMVIDLVSQWGVEGTRSPHTGVWVGNSKICAMGVHSSNLVTSHGLALNCDTDLGWFKHIVPCGIEGAGVTSLTEQVGKGRVGVEETEKMLVRQFAETFKCETEPVESSLRDTIMQSL